MLKKYYPQLDAQPAYELAGLQIRYLKLDVSRMAPLSRGAPVEALVFVSYERGVGLEQRRLTATEALARLFQARSKLDLRLEFLAETLRWLRSVPAYELIYSDLDRAVECASSDIDRAT
jgi:hypothetical protein